MAVTLTIKRVPERLAARLRERAAQNHRSLQKELMFLSEQAVNETAVGEPQADHTPRLKLTKAGIGTPKYVGHAGGRLTAR